MKSTMALEFPVPSYPGPPVETSQHLQICPKHPDYYNLTPQATSKCWK